MQIIGSSSSYTGLFNALSKIYSTEGLMSLWRGVGSVALGAGPSHAVYFASYEKCKEMFCGEDNSNNFLGHGAAGACATVLSEGLMNPFDGTNFIPLGAVANYEFSYQAKNASLWIFLQ
jgi:solute carrier family 25 iron transporter 28/37